MLYDYGCHCFGEGRRITNCNPKEARQNISYVNIQIYDIHRYDMTEGGRLEGRKEQQEEVGGTGRKWRMNLSKVQC